MGVVNVTPDSFSDGGDRFDPTRAIQAVHDMVDAGASIVDIGGESTRPGAEQVPTDVELERVIPVVAAAVECDVAVSIDTSKPEVAAAAVAAGAHIVNDVTGLENTDMVAVVADTGAGVVIMHMAGTPRTMQDNPTYDDVVTEVVGFLVDRARTAEAAGVQRSQIALDPGIGFGKTLEHNLALLASTDRLVETRYPVVIGASRKRFLGALLEPYRGATDPKDRDAATLGVLAHAITAGAQIHRVHDVRSGVEVAHVVDAIVRAEQG